MKRLLFLCLCAGLLTLNSCKEEKSASAPEATPAETVETAELTKAQMVAQKAGIDNWNSVKRVAFTMNVERPGGNLSPRQWEWFPKTDRVTLISNGETVTYRRGTELDSISSSADRAFINDTYWLLPQFKLVWDEGANITYPETNKIRIAYGEEGGYTPGDTYDFTINDKFQFTSWDYTPSWSEEPILNTSFENYQNFNGIEIATEHKKPDGSLNIKFTDVSIDR